MITARPAIPFPGTIFDPNSATHIDFLNQEMKQFKHNFEKIKDFDYSLALPPGVTAGFSLCFLTSLGIIGYVLLVAGTSLTSLYVHHHLRANFEDPYQNQLWRLVEIYKWCKSAGPTVTKNQTFNELATLLVPLVQTPVLMLWEGKDQWELSDTFKNLIKEKDPRIEFEVKKEESPSLGARLVQRFRTTKSDAKPTVVETKDIKPVEKSDPEEQLKKDFFNQVSKTYVAARNLLWYSLYSYKPEYKAKTEEKADKSTLADKAKAALTLASR